MRKNGCQAQTFSQCQDLTPDRGDRTSMMFMLATTRASIRTPYCDVSVQRVSICRCEGLWLLRAEAIERAPALALQPRVGREHVRRGAVACARRLEIAACFEHLGAPRVGGRERDRWGRGAGRDDCVIGLQRRRGIA